MQKLKIGTPVKPMLVAESGVDEEKYAEVVKSHNGKSFVEVKSNGYRTQPQKGAGERYLFSKNGNLFNPEVFPELKKVLDNLPNGIFDAELVGIEDGFSGFNAVKKRVRSELDKDLVKQYPIQLKFFDVLSLKGKSLINMPLHERRKILENSVENVSEQQVITDGDVLQQAFIDATDNKGLEGLVCKNPDSEYLVGKRTKDWIKLKKFLTLDLVVLGLYEGKGKFAERSFAALLLGTKNNGQYETIAKVGLANKEMVDSIYKRIRKNCRKTVPKNVIISDAINKKTYAKKVPFCYISPEKSVVLEVKTFNVTKSKNWHSCGFDADENKAHSLMSPVVEGTRYDKEVYECTTTEQISDLFAG